jgi:tRNA dimethylallyltransferase
MPGYVQAMPANKRPTVVFIVGPTAIGKTRLAVKLARRINGEIISADSMQVYKGVDIISQAPARKERRNTTHRFVGMLDPKKEYSVAIFRRSAIRAIASAFKHKKAPIVVGGSGLYVKALIDGLFPSPEADEKFRKKMYGLALKRGSPELHGRLARIDPDAAGLIHPNDARRIIRALEIYHQTGKTMTELKSMTKGLKDKYDIMIFGLTAPRGVIYKNTDKRVDKMLDSGAITEVKRLKKKKLSKTAQAVLGYKEIAGYLDGAYDLDAAKEMLKKNTRNFAKRQLTWFRADKRIRWFDVTKQNDLEIIEKVCMSLRGPKGRSNL